MQVANPFDLPDPPCPTRVRNFGSERHRVLTTTDYGPTRSSDVPLRSPLRARGVPCRLAAIASSANMAAMHATSPPPWADAGLSHALPSLCAKGEGLSGRQKVWSVQGLATAWIAQTHHRCAGVTGSAPDRGPDKKIGAFDRVEKRQTRASVREGSELEAASPPCITKQVRPINQDGLVCALSAPQRLQVCRRAQGAAGLRITPIRPLAGSNPTLREEIPTCCAPG